MKARGGRLGRGGGGGGRGGGAAECLVTARCTSHNVCSVYLIRSTLQEGKEQKKHDTSSIDI